MQADLSTDLVTWKSKPIGYLNSSFPLIRQTLRSNNATTLGKFVGDALLAGCPGCSIVAANAGGIRGVGLQAGLVTYGDVVTLVPFGNWLVTFKIRGTT
jgi:5'-nucleotidase/UDP-sugar diphosphatase